MRQATMFRFVVVLAVLVLVPAFGSYLTSVSNEAVHTTGQLLLSPAHMLYIEPGEDLGFRVCCGDYKEKWLSNMMAAGFILAWTLFLTFIWETLRPNGLLRRYDARTVWFSRFWRIPILPLGAWLITTALFALISAVPWSVLSGWGRVPIALLALPVEVLFFAGERIAYNRFLFIWMDWGVPGFVKNTTFLCIMIVQAWFANAVINAWQLSRTSKR